MRTNNPPPRQSLEDEFVPVKYVYRPSDITRLMRVLESDTWNQYFQIWKHFTEQLLGGRYSHVANDFGLWVARHDRTLLEVEKVRHYTHFVTLDMVRHEFAECDDVGLTILEVDNRLWSTYPHLEDCVSCLKVTGNMLLDESALVTKLLNILMDQDDETGDDNAEFSGRSDLLLPGDDGFKETVGEALARAQGRVNSHSNVGGLLTASDFGGGDTPLSASLPRGRRSSISLGPVGSTGTITSSGKQRKREIKEVVVAKETATLSE